IPLVLALAGLVLGVTSTTLEGVLEPHTALVTAVPDTTEVHLGLWHGWGLPLAVSAAIWTLGTLWWGVQARRPVEVPIPLSPVDLGRTYQQLTRGLDRAALEITGFVQRGSLPMLLGTILAVLVVLPAVQLLTFGATWPEEVRL